MASKDLESMFAGAMQGIRSMIDVNTVIGTPVDLGNGTTIIPVSKVAFGFGMGGWNKDENESALPKQTSIAGGNGGGVTVSPIGFLIVRDDEIKMINVDSTTAAEKLIDSMPGMITSVSNFFAKNK